MTAVRHLVTKAFPEQVRTRRMAISNANNQIKIRIGFNINSEVINISETGLAISSDKVLSEDIEHPFELYFSESKPLSLKGKVVWIRSEGDKYIHGIALSGELLPEGLLEAYEEMSNIISEIVGSSNESNKIDLRFKELTNEIQDYLTIVKSKLDKLQDAILVDSASMKESYKFILQSSFEKAFVDRLKEFSCELDFIFSKFDDKKVKKIHIKYFREKVGHFYTNNSFIGRALRKPRGYAGDFEMMNQIYRDTSEGKTFFEMLMHRYGINEASSLSVKYRKNYLINKIKERSENHKRFVVGSLACGPAREVVEFLDQVEISDSARFTFVLMDQDMHSLLNAKRNITERIVKRGLLCEIIYVPLSVKNVLEQSEQAQILNDIRFDFVYSAGLYDYLTQPVAQLLTAYLFESVNKDGLLIIGNFHPDNPTKTISELVADWSLIHRSDDEMMDLIPDHSVKKKLLHKDEQEIDLFLEIYK